MESKEKMFAICDGLDEPSMFRSSLGNFSDKNVKVICEQNKEKEEDNTKAVACKRTGTQLVLARRLSPLRDIQEMFGNNEADMTCGDESELHQHYDDCVKNPKHIQFKCMRMFSLRDLPRKYQQENLCYALKMLGSLTVRVAVSTVSEVRRAAYLKAGKKVKDPPFVVYGTGRIFKVLVFSGKDTRKCPCQECKNPGAIRKSWGSLEILTAKHLVYDVDEACGTLCRWGYDGDDCTEINFVGISAKVSLKDDDDWCKMKCVTHNVELLERIQRDIQAYEIISSEIYKTCWGNPKKKLKFVAIISHPHGCPKQITFGYWRSCNKSGTLDLKYTYNAATCHGSSGAPVFILGRDGRLGLYHHIHSGSRNKAEDTDKNHNNYSTCVFD